MKKDKSFIRYFIALAIPVVIQQLLVNLLAITDTIMVGGISENAISAITVANKFFLIYNLAIFGLTNGVGLFISQYYGAKDHDNCNRTLHFGLILVCLLSFAGMGILILCPDWVLTIFVKDTTIIEMGRQYNDIVRFSYLPYGISQMMAIAYRVKGDSSLPLGAGIVSFVLNIFLNYVLIFGKLSFPQMGIEGAALATALSRLAEALVLIMNMFKKNDEYYIFKKYGFLSKEKAIEIIHKSLPLICNETIWALSMNLIFLNYCFVDESYIPALTVVDQIGSLSYVVFAGFASAVGVVIGNTLGANELDKAKDLSKIMLRIGLMINVVVSIFVAATSFVIPGLYSLGKESTVMATRLLLIKCAFMWTQGYSETVYYVLRAGGDTKSVFLIDGFFMICGPLLMSYLFTRVFNVDTYMLFAIVEGVYVLKIFVATYFYHKETWLKNLTLEIV